jgi:hypothetical protein
VFVLYSKAANLYAYYDERFEVTRGVTSLELDDNTLLEGSAIPAPNANLGGAQAWTCRSSITQEVDWTPRQPDDPAPDVYAMLDPAATFSLSDHRVAEILRQRTCASFVAVEAAGFGTRRDLVLIALGTVIALGVELTRSGLTRRGQA